MEYYPTEALRLLPSCFINKMRTSLLLLLPFSGITLSKPINQVFYDAGSNRQVVMQGQVFDVPSNPQPGFNLNLDELRLVQLSEGQEPVWMTELEKVRTTHCTATAGFIF